MRKAEVFVNGYSAGVLEEVEPAAQYRFTYRDDYQGPPISLTMPTVTRTYSFSHFPAAFEGLLPEGAMLDGLLRQAKLDRNDCFGQLVLVGANLVGALTVKEIK